MKRVNFYLKKAEPGTGLSLIYLQAKYSGQRLVFTFSEHVNPKSWSDKKQRVKTISSTTADGKHNLNEYLDSLEKHLVKSYNDELKNGIPDPELLKAKLRDYVKRNLETGGRSKKTTLTDIIEMFIRNEVGDIKKPNTVKKYKTAMKHLQDYEKKNKVKIDFEDINIPFRDKYVRYLQSLGLQRNSVGKDIKIIKTFMNYALEEGYTQNSNHNKKKFGVTEVETDSVYLTENEILKLYRTNLTENKPLERVRDIFVVGCFVGLRFGDYSSRIRPENMVNHDGELFLQVLTEKTGVKVVVPIHPVVMEILEKYNNNLPKAISNQPFNRAIKEACSSAKLNEKGRLPSAPEKPLYECVSSHTARRSFATNYFLQGFPMLDLMRITGHKTEKSFLRYIKSDKLESAKRLSSHIKKNWAEKMLRVAS